jgi:hypothetical protein
MPIPPTTISALLKIAVLRTIVGFSFDLLRRADEFLLINGYLLGESHKKV